MTERTVTITDWAVFALIIVTAMFLCWQLARMSTDMPAGTITTYNHPGCHVDCGVED